MIGTRSKIFVAGCDQMIGTAMLNCLRAAGYTNLISKSRDQLNFTDQEGVRDFLRKEEPEYIFLLATNGGILANVTYPWKVHTYRGEQYWGCSQVVCHVPASLVV